MIFHSSKVKSIVEQSLASITRTVTTNVKKRTTSGREGRAFIAGKPTTVGADEVSVRTLRKRTEANQPTEDVKPLTAVSTAKTGSKTTANPVKDEAMNCCNKPLTTSKSNRLRNETKPSVETALKPLVGVKGKLGDATAAAVKRTKNGSGQSLKENNVGGTQLQQQQQQQKSEPDWYWPPKVNDMVVGLFEDGWYIGKALEITAKGDKVKIKFMEDRNFKVTQRFWKWPRVNDVQVRLRR